MLCWRGKLWCQQRLRFYIYIYRWEFNAYSDISLSSSSLICSRHWWSLMCAWIPTLCTFFCRLFFARETSDDEWGKLQEWKMEFLYFETWRSEACSLEQTIYMFLNRDLFCCVWMCFKILLDCSFCTSIRIMILCTRHRD